MVDKKTAGAFGIGEADAGADQSLTQGLVLEKAHEPREGLEILFLLIRMTGYHKEEMYRQLVHRFKIETDVTDAQTNPHPIHAGVFSVGNSNPVADTGALELFAMINCFNKAFPVGEIGKNRAALYDLANGIELVFGTDSADRRIVVGKALDPGKISAGSQEIGYFTSACNAFSSFHGCTVNLFKKACTDRSAQAL
jgi:hypothetical protein